MQTLSVRCLMSASFHAGDLLDALREKTAGFFARIGAERRRRRVPLERLILRLDTARWHDSLHSGVGSGAPRPSLQAYLPRCITLI